MKFSTYQKNVFNCISSGVGNIHVDACAGSGKTTTILECVNRIESNKKILMIAFNKRNVEDISSRIGKNENVSVKTFHSLGLSALKKRNPKIIIDNNKLKNILNDITNAGYFANYIERYFGDISRLVQLCKNMVIRSHDEILNLIEDFQIPIDLEDQDSVIPIVLNVLDRCEKNDRVIDFDDMIWLPIIHNLPLIKYDFVMVDEAQDLNEAQIFLSLNSVKKKGRILSVGDERQAIYRFRGAGEDSISKIVMKMNSIRYPLSVTYRSGKNIVKEAQNFVGEDHIKAYEGNQDGNVDSINVEKLFDLVKGKDFILCRKNAPLVSMAIKLIANKIPAMILGRDISANIKKIIKKSRASTIESLLNFIEKYQKIEIEKCIAKEKSYDLIVDTCECITSLADECKDIKELNYNIDILFGDLADKNKVILSTVHKSKGMETENVFLLWNHFRFSSKEENNINYVAVTRAKKNLYFVSE